MLNFTGSMSILDVLAMLLLGGFVMVGIGGSLCALAYLSGGVSATVRRLGERRERSDIPRPQLRALDVTLQEAEELAALGQPEAGHALLAGRLAEAREGCDPHALWWGPLMGRWQSEVARYERRHDVRPAAELAPCGAPPRASALVSPVQETETRAAAR